MADSPALDAGDNSADLSLVEADLGIDLNDDGDTDDTLTTVAELAFDQRGDGFERILDTTVDIGAVETVLDLEVTTLDDEDDGVFDATDLSLREALQLVTSGSTITFADGLAGTIALDSALGALDIDRAVSINGDIDGDGIGDIIIDGQGGTQVLNVYDGSSSELAVSLSNITITGSGSAGFGGGIFNSEALEISNAIISDNSAARGSGILNVGTLTITDSVISGNSASNDGGGINNYDGSTTIIDSTISGNTTSADGGAIYARTGTVTIVNSTLSSNSASDGGGIYTQLVSTDLTVTNSTISSNTATRGGGVYISDAVASFTNTTFTGNSASSNGGGIFNDGRELTLTNSLISGNDADSDGDGSGSGDEVFNSFGLVSDNNLFGHSGLTYSEALDGVSLGNSDILATSTTDDGSTNSDATALTDILDTTLADNGGSTLTHALVDGSPAINVGTNPEDLETDQPGEDRVADGQADIGAFELQLTTLSNIVVTTLEDEDDGILSNDISLREALGAIASGGTITFDSSLTDGTISLENGELAIDRAVTIDAEENSITIDAQSNSRVFNVNDGDNSTAVDVSLSGLTITGGSSSEDGGGIYNRESLAIASSTISGNSATDEGGAITSVGATLSLTDSTVSGNSADDTGGGIYTLGGTLNLTNTNVSGNSAADDGGGIHTLSNTTSTLTNTTVSGNSAADDGGGIYNGVLSTLSLTSSTISGNSATSGGGIYNDTATTNLTNTILAGNTATSNGSEIANTANVNADANNLLGDSSQTTAEAFDGFTPDLTGSDLVATSDGNLGTGGIALDAILDSTGLQDNGGPTQTIALADDSPAINAGTNPDDLETDQRGETRVVDDQTDIGAFEVQLTESTNIVVTTLDDEDDGLLTNGISLREALDAIDSGGTITFDSSLAAGTISLENGELAIAESVSIDGDIDGDGVGDITIDAQGNSRVLNVDDGDDTNEIAVSLSNLTITGGTVIGDRGGIYNQESLAIASSTISGNSAHSGAGIFNDSGTLTLGDSTVSGNSATDDGGGIFGTGTLTLVDSTVSGNSATGNGGGIGTLFGTTNLTNSTISGNSSAGDGGGVYTFFGTTSLTNTIVAGNTATAGNEIANFGTTNADANNLLGDSSQDNDAAFIGFTPDLTGSDLVATSDGNLGDGVALSDILDATLSDNGGPTETIALADGSPAIDAGDNSADLSLVEADLGVDLNNDGDTDDTLTTVAELAFDQRGDGFDRIFNTTIDIGAVESSSIVVEATDPEANSNDAAVDTDIAITFSDDINEDTATSSTIVVNTSQTAPSNDTVVTTSGESVTLNPNADFQPGEEIEVTVTSGVESSAGDSATSQVLQFRTEVTAGAGSFTSTTNGLGSNRSLGVELGDIDGDGDIDAVFANIGNDQIYLNDGSGNFSSTTTALGNTPSEDLALGDVDGDGDLDAVIAKLNQANRVYLNDGSGNFSSTTNALGSYRSADVSLGDVDGDGDLDAVFANVNQANRVYLNDGSGNFSSTTDALGSYRSADISLGDVDGDGDLDAVFANYD
ncbi:beta strand repeat-containing protein [Dapis sp. BLCC M229]|uniref:beta strand repeat-containing protein n=1 Tax=Dapis sp. BLCC M229 TaxID=3400188 RepID=UPI003CF629D9